MSTTTRRHFLHLMAAAPIMNLKEAYDQLQRQQQRFTRRFGEIVAELTWEGNQFTLTLSKNWSYSNLSMSPNTACQMSQISFTLEEAQALAHWIQEATAE